MSVLSRHAAIARPAPRFSALRLLDLWRQRQHLGRLDDAALDDIGLDRHSAQQEAARPVWDVPAHWRR